MYATMYMKNKGLSEIRGIYRKLYVADMKWFTLR